MKQIETIFVICVCLSVCVGCGSQDTVPAGGTVSVDGKLVTGGFMQFYPVGGGRPASARIMEDGSFVISYRKPGDGLPPGKYKVSVASAISKSRKTNSVEGGEFNDGLAVGAVDGKVINVVPTIYNSLKTTPLIQEVEAGTKQEFHFDIPSSKKK